MARYTYRCSRCRTRNTFNRKVDDYIIPRKCRGCGHRHFYVDKERMTRIACICMGYHFPHRPGSACCEQHPLHLAHRARRAGADQETLRTLYAEEAFDNPPKPWKGNYIPL